ncbi:hypothetical protein R5R35_006121 [Gryllus longicercus]|uniref:Ankyrin repeat protein n=1 Tax=Gryllus longicercus TaxID=2509291 RepID=A0AAN9VZ62_9ORTH
MPHFLHYTFIEYFGACWLLENQEKGSEVAKEVWLRLLNRDVGVGVRHILEHMLSDGLPLHRAVLEGSEGALEAALEAGGDPDESDRFGRTALVQAASLGRADAVGALLAKGCDPGRGDALLGWTALRYASACGHLEAAERLLRGGADPDHFVTHNIDIRDLVFKAAEKGWPAIMEKILKKKDGYKDIRFEKGITPIMIAAMNGQTCTVQILLKYGASVSKKDIFNRQPIHYALCSRNIEIPELLLKRRADPNARDQNGKTPLLMAARADTQLTELLLEHGADVNAKDDDQWTALHHAIQKRHHQNMKLLLDRKADPNAVVEGGYTPLMTAAVYGDAQSTEILLEHGADVTQRDGSHMTALHYAVECQHHQIVMLLLESKADLNAVNKWDETPLMMAARAGDEQSTKLLLEHVDVSQRNGCLMTALHYAVERRHHQMMMLLLESKADPNAEDKRGETPLMTAVRVGDEQSTEILLKHGADVNRRNKRDMTALHYATRIRHYQITKLLLENKADPNAGDKLGETPLMMAARPRSYS